MLTFNQSDQQQKSTRSLQSCSLLFFKRNVPSSSDITDASSSSYANLLTSGHCCFQAKQLALLHLLFASGSSQDPDWFNHCVCGHIHIAWSLKEWWICKITTSRESPAAR